MFHVEHFASKARFIDHTRFSFLLFAGQVNEDRLVVHGRQESFQTSAVRSLSEEVLMQGWQPRYSPRLYVLIHQQLHLIFSIIDKAHNGGGAGRAVQILLHILGRGKAQAGNAQLMGKLFGF